MKKRSLLLLLFITLFISCNKDDTIDKQIPVPPVIELDSETGIYTIKIGRKLTIAPTVHYAEGAMYSWIVDGKLAGTEATFTGSWNEPAELMVTFRVETDEGKAEEELRIDVLELTPPVISLALPSQGLKVLSSTDYIFAPDIQNDEEDLSFSCEWLRDGKVVSTEPTYTFNESELGLYTVVIKATNIDGEDTHEIPVEVVDQLPYKVAFDTPSYLQTSTDRYTFAGRPIFLYPLLEYFDNPKFEWTVDGESVTGATGRTFKFTPTTAGEYKIAVSVSDSPGDANVRMSRNITRAETKLTAEVTVHCTSKTENDLYRAATATSSNIWNKVYEYIPAPGQFIGEMKTGGFTGQETTHEQALAYAEERLGKKIWVSLGGFGGYITVGFDHSIPNSGGDYDFTIQGNAFDGSSEPGIIWVMQDINNNGLPDDEWYELKGSETGKPETIQDYEITYYRPAGKGMDVQWTDSRGKSGSIDYLIQYHNQDYYYPGWIKEDTYILRGTRLESRNVQDPTTGYWANQTYDWGYADNFGEDNLGGDPVDGSGQNNGFRISNAIYRDGTPANLKYIDFIKVQVGVNTKSGWLGEVSTEVFSFTDLSITPNN